MGTDSSTNHVVWHVVSLEVGVVLEGVRIMWPNIICMMPLLLTNKYSVSCEIMQYFYDVR